MKRLIVWLSLAVLLLGCSAKPRENSRTFPAMDTVMSITAYGAEDDVMNDAVKLVQALENTLSVTRQGSDLYALNASGQHTVSEDTAALLKTGLEICRRSDGLLDLTIYPVLRSWGFTENNYRIPGQEEIDTLLSVVDYTAVKVSGREVTIPDGAMLDLGSLGKGYAGDKLCAYLRSKGIRSACVNLGGNVQAVGSKPDGSAWKVGIQDPESDQILGIVRMTDQAVITSGMYQRYFVGEDGKTYGHILDPRTGCPADSGLLSVTVVGSSGAVCDGLSTALFVAGLDQAEKIWRESRDFEAIFVMPDGSVVMTEGLEGTFTLTQDRELKILKR